ncbi:hypothetical protein GUJ93_ZPchr0006g44421 [Zizania palustris]|uniref:Uncharacterized protein n=1 Tax=Zizania palustris TaxID=103762 RepID=A0A8J5VSJ5_ZIZPA|nr:hypothetical protein GUJ93_ZPchr0006g44421 [Zizania palustris]
MAPTTTSRVRLLAVVLIACVLVVRSAGAGAEEGAPAPSASGFFGCNPLTDKTCRLAGDPRAAENQEEEGVFGFKLPSMPSIPVTGGDDDDEIPSFRTHLTILGH